MRLTLLRRMNKKFDFSKMFDETPEELDKMRRRAELRNKLKLEFNRFYYNPYSSAYGVQYVDPQLERWYATRFYRLEYWKPHWGSFAMFFLGIIAPTLILIRYFLCIDREWWEKTQSGEKNYRNREVMVGVFY